MANDIIDINVYETIETVSITVNPNLTTVNINQVTSSGGGTNLSTTQTASNFTINSDTGDDALVPLGNGTLAGATLNDYTTAEKNKLVDTYTKGEVDTKITGVYKVKGSVANYAALPSSGQVIGDVWNLLDTGGNYVWTGTTWDELGTTIDISGKANINSPTFTGIPLAPTATAGTNNTQIATTAFTTTAIAGKMNNPSLTASYIPKALTASTIGNSMLFDTGTYLGINVINTPVNDITLGRQNNKFIGIEQSDSYTQGRTLVVEAGRTINFAESASFISNGQTISSIETIAKDPYNVIWVLDHLGNNYYKPVGSNLFILSALSTAPLYNNRGNTMAFTSTNDLYLVSNNLLRQRVNNSGAWVNTGISCNFVAIDGNDVYIAVNGVDIYKKTNNTGSFVALGTIPYTYQGLMVHPITKDIYISTSSNILKLSGGTYTTVANVSAYSLFRSSTNDFYYANSSGIVFRQTNFNGAFVNLGAGTQVFGGSQFVEDELTNIFTPGSGTINILQLYAVGISNLQGGTLKLNAGTGKGTGASDIEMYTGQVLASGTDMQTSTLRAKIDNTGLMTLPSVTNALIIADTTGKAVATKEYVASVAGGVPYTGATTDVDLGLNDITATTLIKQGGTSSQILAADGSVITAGTNITITGGQISSVGGAGGGGSSVNYYLNGGTSQGTFGGSTYYEFSKTAVIGTGADFNINTNGYIASFITDVADPSLLLIPAGNWNLEFFFSSSSAGGSPSFYVELYKYDGTTFTSIASSSATPEGITNGTSIDAYFTPLAVPETILTVNDRLAIRVYVNASSKTITLHTQNGHLCEVITTFTAGLTALNGLQAQVQNFATGTSGTDFAINSSGSTHTFNLPTASASNRGALSSANWTTFNNKQDTLQSTVNIKSINGNSILGSGDLTISGTGISSLNGLTGATQTFSVLTNVTGSPSFSSTGTNHQLRLPNAAVNVDYGLVTNIGQSFGGTKTFQSNPEIPVPAGNSGPCIVLGSTGGGGATGTLSIGDTVTYPNGVEMQRVKGVTSNIQTQLNGKQPTLTAGNGINITSNTISTVDTSRAAYTMLANNTNASAIPTTQPFENLTNQVYSGTIVWTGGTAPSGTTDHTYSLSQIGNLVTLTINLAYGTASGGTVSSVTMELPSTAPTPALPSSVTTALDVVNYGAGMIISSKVLATTAAAFCALRLKSTSPNVFEIVISRVASTHRYAYATIQYFVQ
jgi:hypothetical protein